MPPMKYVPEKRERRLMRESLRSCYLATVDPTASSFTTP